MTPQATLPVLEDDIRLYPNHEEDDVPEGTLHNRWSSYLVYSLAARFPDWFAAGNICVYWEPGNSRDYVAPDAFVAGRRVPERSCAGFSFAQHGTLCPFRDNLHKDIPCP